MTDCIMTEAQVEEAFLAAPPTVDQQILNLTVRSPSWLRDIGEMAAWPLGQGTIMKQLIFRGEMPQIEEDFSLWKKLENNTGCDPCDGPDCSYNWTLFGGSGIDEKIVQPMERDFRSPSYCVKKIQTTFQFEEIFAQIVQNLYAQVNFFKEQNVMFLALTQLAKKYVVDSAGPKPNTENPYVYRNIGTARLGTLGIDLLEFFYEWMVKIPDCIPYDVVNGAPVFGLISSRQMLSRLYRDDPNLRQDVRFSGAANDLLTKYNFMSTIRGMFIPAPILYPRRFNIVNGEPVRVLPFVKGIPAQVGSYTGFNPAYEAATHEEVILHGKAPFKIFYVPTKETLGGNISFGPEVSWFDNWQWVNPQTNQDPFRREGFFATSAKIGISQQFSEGIFSILVERPSVQLTAIFTPEPVCPPTPVECDNEVPGLGCPCPLILSYSANPITSGNFYINLAVPIDVVADDEVQFGIDTGGYLTGTVVALSSDGKAVEVTFPEGTDLGVCDHFTSIFCDNTLGCSSNVMKYNVNCSDNTRLDLYLQVPIKADTAADVVTIYYGDGSSASATVVSVDMTQNLWIVDIGGSAFCDNVGGVVSICVPTATDATCPACSNGTSFAECEDS